MVTLKDFMEVVEYRITEGSEYTWTSFGPNAYRLDSFTDRGSEYSISIVFDTKNQTVYEVEAHDYNNNRSYRYTNPLFVEAARNEAERRGVDFNEAYDDVKFVDLEVEDDWIDKAKAIVNGETYDTRVKIPLELSKDEMLNLMTQAHEQDVTLNDYIERILRNYIVEYEVHGRQK